MKLIFHRQTVADFVWMRRYYKNVFPEGDEAAKIQYKRICVLLVAHPFVGAVVDQKLPVREFHIPKTPFSVVYFVKEKEREIVVIRVLDNRAQRPDGFEV